MQRHGSAIIGYVVLIVLLSGGAAQSLSGSNTVFSDDIVDKAVTANDLGTNSVTKVKVNDDAIGSAEVVDDSLTGADIKESTLSGPSGRQRNGSSGELSEGIYQWEGTATVKSATAINDQSCSAGNSSVVFDLAANVDTTIAMQGILTLPIHPPITLLAFDCGDATVSNASFTLIRLGNLF